jgi:transposase
VWYSREIPADTKIKSGSFCQDNLGHWYINIVVDIPEVKLVQKPTAEVGIDLGLKDLAVLSDGKVIPIFKYYRKNEKKLGLAQRANKKGQVKKIHRKISNSRKDSAFKIANDLVKNYALIVVGNVSPSKLGKTKMAKSVYDAGWTLLKKQVEYLAITHQSVFLEVNESFTTQACSSCGNRTGPKGLKDLGIREWKCPVCDTVHDRDVNSAKNILRIGHDTLGVGIPFLTA